MNIATEKQENCFLGYSYFTLQIFTQSILISAAVSLSSAKLDVSGLSNKAIIELSSYVREFSLYHFDF